LHSEILVGLLAPLVAGTDEMHQRPQPADLTSGPGFLRSGGEMRERIRAHDWAPSSLGPPAGWPPPLKTVLGIMLSANQPMFVAWGPARILIYNDAYIDILGGNHPSALGRPFFEVWPELFDRVGPIMDRAFVGEPTFMDDIELVLHRHGYPEEAHFSFVYAPMQNDDGEVDGVFCACSETTRQVLAKREQRETETRNRQILDSAIDYAVIATDLNGRVTRWNEGAHRILGWTESEMLGQTISRIFTPEDRASDERSYEARFTAEAGAGNHERWHVRKDGQRFWASGEVSPLRNEAGDIVGFVKVLRDHTDQRRAESRLRESEARFRSLAEATPGFIWTADAEGASTYASPRWYSYSGTRPGQAEGDGWLRSVHPEDRERTQELWSASVASGDLFETELRLCAADGSYHWWLVRALPIRDESGAISAWAGVCTDITAIVAAREALARLSEELEVQVAERTADRNRAWTLSTDVMVVTQGDSTITAVNPAWTTVLGWAEHELIGRSFFDFVHPDDAACTRGAAALLGEGTTVQSFETRYRHSDGSYRWLSWTGVPGGGFITAVGRDITGEKARAEALAKTEEALRQSQKMEAVGQLTGGLAHDFNNLLTGISGSLELLSARLVQGRLQDAERYITAAQGAAKRAASLTHRLLAFSRRQTLDPRPTDVNRLIADMEELIRRTVGPAVAIEVVGASGLWSTMVDPNQLENALLNLCINARDAMPNGGRITIETANKWLDQRAARERELPPGQYLCLSVSDTGTGMSPEVVRRAFDPFFTTKPIGQGTGLGLSMIYGFVRQSGGQVRISSELGAGTTMSLYLPRHGDGAEPAEDVPSPRAVRRSRQGETVLVIDDEPTVRMLAADVLDELGYSAIEAEDGPEGLKVLESGVRIDLLITDVGLPGGMNGRQVADAGRAIRPGLKVLFITGYAENAIASNGYLDQGMQMMTKPFSMDALAERIKDLLAEP
jgi:PAS domain S-box-containing protein